MAVGPHPFAVACRARGTRPLAVATAEHEAFENRYQRRRHPVAGDRHTSIGANNDKGLCRRAQSFCLKNAVSGIHLSRADAQGAKLAAKSCLAGKFGKPLSEKGRFRPPRQFNAWSDHLIWNYATDIAKSWPCHRNSYLLSRARTTNTAGFPSPKRPERPKIRAAAPQNARFVLRQRLWP